ncbi:MAG: 30S ribosome-binding factor RbfA [Planctomycetia bacterium]|jgi:ribosome-binding factor A|nr:30S ribosome-binding factor RbfA [Planctomycetota bacterium]NCG00103.1 30S ribosome-binding factor RbfA [Planctomycetia bacterium]NCG57260.1 30S ribosome-binding factor RbfA [Pseudomonadota bacterium]
MKPIRKARITSLIKEEISMILQGELKDPRIGFVSVLGAEPTIDLKECKIFVSILGSESEQRTSLRGLEAARGRIQALLRSRVRLRETPILKFILDESYKKTLDIEDKIRKAREEDEAAAEERDSRADQDSAN